MSGPSYGCKTGLQFFTCKSNGFQGCCSINPCTLSGCPVADDGNDSDTDVATTSSEGSISADSNPSSARPSTFSTSTLSSTLSSTRTFQSSAAATSTPFEIATLLAPPFAGGGSSAESYSTVLVTSFLLVSQVFITPTSNGVELPPTSSMATSTMLSSMPVSFTIPVSTIQGSAPSSTLPSATSSSGLISTDTPSEQTHDHSDHTPAIAGSVGSVGGLFFAALLIWLLLRWQRLRKEKEQRVFQHDDDPRLQGIDANRAGSVFKDNDDPPAYLRPQANGRGTRRWFRNVTGSSYGSPVSPVDDLATTTDTAHYPGLTHDSGSPGLTELSQDGPGLTELSRDGAVKSELSGEAAPSISELSPTPERSPINKPKRATGPLSNNGGARTEPSPFVEKTLMEPSLSSSPRSPMNEGGNSNGRAHVMSWMDYDANTPSPAR